MAGSTRSAARSPVEQWVTRELRRRYDATLREPIPEELLRLLDEAAPGPDR